MAQRRARHDPEEHRRRGEAADVMFREMKRKIAAALRHDVLTLKKLSGEAKGMRTRRNALQVCLMWPAWYVWSTTRTANEPWPAWLQWELEPEERRHREEEALRHEKAYRTKQLLDRMERMLRDNKANGLTLL